MTYPSLKKQLPLKEAKALYQRYLNGNGSFPKPSFDWWWYMEEVDSTADYYLAFEDWIGLRNTREMIITKPKSEELGGVSAIQFGNYRVEYINPDYSFAYAALIPDVTAAFAYLDCGEPDKARKALLKALQSIDSFRKQNGVFAVHT